MSATAVRTAIEPLFMVERRAIVQALRACHGNRNGAAYYLQIGKTTLYRKIHDFEITVDEYMADLPHFGGTR